MRRAGELSGGREEQIQAETENEGMTGADLLFGRAMRAPESASRRATSAPRLRKSNLLSVVWRRAN